MSFDRSGTKLGIYRLERLLGEGGMGEVYVAVDERLGRTVALKILRPEVAADKEHRARFEREAKALAALKHPGIVAIYALEEADGDAFFVMDLVEGQTLTKLIRKEGAFPVSRILDLAIPISDAIAAAHKQGISHRDIKPDNIIVGPRDEVTVLDFGLAKNQGIQFAGEHSGVAASAMKLTQEGRIVGTINYMAPEQVEAGKTSLATDVFSLGVVIYEMASGELPFQGDSAMSILSSILKEPPVDMSVYQKAVPTELETLMHRCLEKDPDRRWQSALDVRNELEIIRGRLQSGELSVSAASDVETQSAGRGGLLWMAATALFAVSTGVLSSVLLGRGPAEEAAAPMTVTVDEVWTFDCLTSDPGMEASPSLSPNAEFITFSMRSTERDDETSIYLLRVGGNRPIELTTEMAGDEQSPRFSPDGERIAFRSGRVSQTGALYVMGATGESLRRIDFDGFSPDWSPDGKKIVCSTEGYNEPHGRPTHGALAVIDVESGQSTEIYAGDAVDPRWSPNGEWIIFWTVGMVDASGKFQITGRRDIGVLRADGSEARLITDDVEFDWSPTWAEDGRKIIFSSNRGGPIGLWELEFDPENGQVGTKPRPFSAPSTYAGSLDVSRDGRTIAYVDGMSTSSISRVKIDLDTLELIGLPERVFEGGFGNLFDVSDDGEQIVVSGGPMRSDDIYVSRGDGSGIRQITDDAFRNLQPVFNPDGEHIRFFSNRSGDYEGWICRVDGGGFTMVTDGWRLINTPAVNPIDGMLATAVSTAEEWYLTPGDSQEVAMKDVKAMPKVDQNGRWFFPYEYDDTGQRILGLVNYAGDASPLADRRVGVYDVEDSEYQVVEESIIEAPFTVAWAPDDRRYLLGNRSGLWVYDPDSQESKQVFELDVDFDGNLEFQVTKDGYLYYAVPENERDIWLGRLAPAKTLTRFGK